MVQLKPCPVSKIKSAETNARHLGHVHLVIFDEILSEYRVVSAQAYRNTGMQSMQRYDVVYTTLKQL